MTDLLDRLHQKENEIARLMTENIRLRREIKNAWEICPYDQDGCLLETSEIGPCLCVNPVRTP